MASTLRDQGDFYHYSEGSTTLRNDLVADGIIRSESLSQVVERGDIPLVGELSCVSVKDQINRKR